MDAFTGIRSEWVKGNWSTVDELKLVEKAIILTVQKMGRVGNAKFRSAFGNVKIRRWGAFPNSPAFAPFFGNIVLPDYHFNGTKEYATFNIIHELGHVWDWRSGGQLSRGMQERLGTKVCLDNITGEICYYDIFAGKESPPGDPDDPYAGSFLWEDWPEAFATYVYPDYYDKYVTSHKYKLLGTLRRQYVEERINAIP